MGGRAWQGGVRDGEHAWWGGVHGRGYAWKGAGVVGNMRNGGLNVVNVRSMCGRYTSYWNAFLCDVS